MPAGSGQAVVAGHIFTVAGVVLAFVLAHNILYTYIAPFLAAAGMAERTDLVLLVFGPTSLLGILITGMLIDRHLRSLTLASTALFGLSAVALSFASDAPAATYAAVAAWGLAFDGAATLFQTAIAKTRDLHCVLALTNERNILHRWL